MSSAYDTGLWLVLAKIKEDWQKVKQHRIFMWKEYI
jgi:hypothetical protein